MIFRLYFVLFLIVSNSFSQNLDSRIIQGFEKIDFDYKNFNITPSKSEILLKNTIIDKIINNPLSLPSYTEKVGKSIIDNHKKSPLKVTRLALEMLTDKSFYDDFDRATISTDIVENKMLDFGFTEEYVKVFIDLYVRYEYSKILVSSALNKLSEEELYYFYSNPTIFLTSNSFQDKLNFIKHAEKVDLEKIFSASVYLTDGIEEYIEKTKDFSKKDFYNSNSDKFFTFDDVAIGGFNDDTYTENYGLSIDTGGKDTYQNNAGGTAKDVKNVAILIEHSGDDSYDNKSDNFTLGAGFLGIGVLVDLSGNDRYFTKHFTQGIGVLGVGILADYSGNELYNADIFCQGAGLFGVGLLLDSDGGDYRECASYGQGFALSYGIGVLSDLKGSDRNVLNYSYEKDMLGQKAGYGQGASRSYLDDNGNPMFYGGIGILVDNDGGDRYRSRGECTQGGGDVLSLGVLFDFSGDDIYHSVSGQGWGRDFACGILVDKAGNDSYKSENRGGAYSKNNGVGIFLEYEGTEFYKSKMRSFGYSEGDNSLSLFVDFMDNDIYDKLTDYGKKPVDEPFSLGFSNGETTSKALFLDFGGKDDYTKFKRKDKSSLVTDKKSLFWDL